MNHTFSILGGGIGGLCTAVALQKAGFQATVYEAAPEIKALGAGIMLASNANQALNHLGLWPELKALGHIPDFMIVADNKGKLIQKMDNQRTAQTYGFPTLTIHRAALQQLLLDQLAPDSLVLGKKGQSVRQDGEQVHLQFEDGSEISTDYLIAADGIHSPIRTQLLPEVQTRYAGYTCWRGVAEQRPEGFDEKIFSETWGSKGRFGIAPLKGGKVYWFACKNAAPNDPKMGQYGKEEILEIFKNFHFPIPQLIRHTATENIIWNDIVDLKPIKSYAFDRIVLLGDAAHATTPNMGQGACQAIEGAVILAECLKKAEKPETAFKAYEQTKLGKAQWVVNNSWRFGKIAQLSNPLICSLRNSLFRMIPAKSSEKRMEQLLRFESREAR